MEYFFDTDPGFGSGLPISVSPDTQVDISPVLDLSSVTPGYHLCYIRAKDATGKWGIPQEQTIYVQNFLAAEFTAAWHELARTHGVRASVALPLKRAETALGQLFSRSK